MQNKLSEEKLAKEINTWLSAWPLIIILTFFVGVYFMERMWIDFNICYRNYSSICKYSSVISNASASLIAGLWSLVFLKYINNKNSAFVRNYGLEALVFAGLCTGILLGSALLDFLGSIDAFIYIAILIILGLWYLQTKNGSEKIKKEFEENSENLPSSISPKTQDEANEVLNLPSNQATEKSIEDFVLIIITGLYVLYFISPFCWYVSAASLSEGIIVYALIPFVLIGVLIKAWQENRKNNKIVAITISVLPAVFIYFLFSMSGL